ncbi:amidohydrolase family protein [Natrialbaceae archaeon A-CW2]|uniref:amidohydrolase family protein n=1 Tax=Natronosalvus amylolyticus TaxID=2961994 RepID=UPI0020C9B9F8|nr:amidohydrolase family protein [Natronosalvus amylolyticus]
MTIETNHAKWRAENGVIDMHTHLGVDYLEEALEYMDQNGITKLVDITPNTDDRFDDLMGAIEPYPDRFGAFGGFDFDGFGESGWIDRELERMERYVDAGAVGFKIHKALGMEYRDADGELIPVDDERLSPLFDKAEALDTVIAFHIADPKSFFEPLDEVDEQWVEQGWWWGDRDQYPYQWWALIRQLERVIERHPGTTFLGVHFGCAAEEVGYVADVMRENPNYIIDVSARLPWFGAQRADMVRDIFLEFQDRILFGTDLAVREPIMLGVPQGFEPTDEDVETFYDAHWQYFETDDVDIDHPTPWVGDWTVDAIDLPRDVLEKFYVTNAERYLGL